METAKTALSAASLKPAMIKVFLSCLPLIKNAAVILDKKKKTKTSKLPEYARLVNKDRIIAKNTAISNPRNRQVSMAAAGIGMIMKNDIEAMSQLIPGLADRAM